MNFMPLRQTGLEAAQRAKGRLALAFRRRETRTGIETFYQEGCLKTRLPRPQNPEICEAVTMNISGGVAGGDSLATTVELHPDARLSLASQAAERVYRALAEPACIATKITVHANAHMEYLPQETILFDGFSLRRSLEIELDESAGFLGVESLVFGRLAMGERVTTGTLRDSITLIRGGKRILQDITRLNGDVAAQLHRKAVGNGATAIMNLTPREKDKLLIAMARWWRAPAGTRREAEPPGSDRADHRFRGRGRARRRASPTLMEAGAHVLTRDQVMEGVAEMIHDVQVEATFPDGTKLVTVHEPIR
jgi:urease accessory protein